MKQEILDRYETLDDFTKAYINSTISKLSNIPEYTNKISDEEKRQIERKKNEERKKKLEDIKNHNKAFQIKCIGMTKQDYIDDLNMIFDSLDAFKLKFFHGFIVAMLEK